MDAEKTPQSSGLRTFAFVSLCCLATSLFTVLVCTQLLTQQQTCDHEVHLPQEKFDYTLRMYDQEKDVTVMKAVNAHKCFIKPGNDQHRAVYDIVEWPLNAQALRLLYGDEVAAFCGSRSAFVLHRVIEHSRTKRQAETDVGGRAKNGCQNNQIVDCTADEVSYTCNTGPGQVYQATIECDAADPTTFSFSLVRRCDQFKATKGARFVKCLLAFVDGTNGEPISAE